MSDENVPVEKWKLSTTTNIVKDRWIDLSANCYVDAQGRTIEPYYVLKQHDWVHVVCLQDDDHIVLVEQYRPAADMICMELPGGVIDEGETPLEAAKRELLEETGIIGQDWVSLGSLAANPALQTNVVHVFGCRQASQGARKLDELEDIHIHIVQRDTLRQAIKDQRFGQMLHIGSLHLAHLGGFWSL